MSFMGRLVKNLVVAVLIVSAVIVAGFSSASCSRENFSNSTEITAEKSFSVVPRKNSAGNDSEFWAKFRESVMPDDKQKGRIPNYEEHHESPPPRQHKPPIEHRQPPEHR